MQINQDKSIYSDKNSSENNLTELNSNTIETNSYTKTSNNRKRNIKLTMSLLPNKLEETKLLSIEVIDYYEVFKEEQIKDITLSIFNNFEEVLLNAVPLDYKF